MPDDSRLRVILGIMKIRKVGNSNVISLPKALLDRLNVKEGDRLQIVTSGGKSYIEKEGA